MPSQLVSSGCFSAVYEAGYVAPFEDPDCRITFSGIAGWKFAVHLVLEHGTGVAIHNLLRMILDRFTVYRTLDDAEAMFLIDTFVHFVQDPEIPRTSRPVSSMRKASLSCWRNEKGS